MGLAKDALIFALSGTEGLEKARLKRTREEALATGDFSKLSLEDKVKMSTILRNNAETAEKLEGEQAFNRFRFPGSNTPQSNVAPPVGQQGIIDPSVLVKAADQLGVPPEFQQSRSLIDSRGRGIIPPDLPADIAKPLIRKIGEENIGIQAAGLKEFAKTKAKFNESSFTSQFNTNLTAETAFDLSTLLVEAYREGGAGGFIEQKLTEGAMKGLGPKDVRRGLRKSTAIKGKRIEIISKMFPTLTQQIGKEGSVRLIESVFQKLGESIPGLEDLPEFALDQLDASMQTMFRINRAIEGIDLNDFDLRDDIRAGLNDRYELDPSIPDNMDEALNEAENKFLQRLQKETGRIKLDKNEQQILSDFKGAALEPLTNYIEELNSGKSSISNPFRAFNQGVKQGGSSISEKRKALKKKIEALERRR